MKKRKATYVTCRNCGVKTRYLVCHNCWRRSS